MSFTAVGEHIGIALPGGTALFTTRRGGVSEGPFGSLNLGLRTEDDPAAVGENRARVERLTGGRIAPIRQVHGTDVVAADPDAPSRDADGQVTAEPGVAALVLVADCLPIALVAPEGVAALHGGWRGLADGVIENGVAALRGLGGRAHRRGDRARAPGRAATRSARRCTPRSGRAGAPSTSRPSRASGSRRPESAPSTTAACARSTTPSGSSRTAATAA